MYNDFLEDEIIDLDLSSKEAGREDILNLDKTGLNHLIIFCHGKADMVNPFFSKLLLKHPLRVIDIEGKKLLSQTAVFLGACETDLFAQLNSPIDEHISMSSALLNNGAEKVIGTMWEASSLLVQDLLNEPESVFTQLTEKQRKWSQDNLKENNDQEKDRNLMKSLCFRIWGASDL
ncbi:MAG: hypothetical protein V2I97_24505 [Desulfococcaceae bacterium]|nr:hypothetical protein [Desulfococcaceae bacterium]